MEAMETDLSFEKCLKRHISFHPQLMPQDIVKFCFQSVFGAEHLMKDTAEAERYFYEEFTQVKPGDFPLSEPLNELYSRADMAAWKYHGLDPEELFRIFAESAEFQMKSGIAEMTECLDSAETVMKECRMFFGPEEWTVFRESYISAGIRPVHHSREYTEAYAPAYRVVRSSLIKHLQDKQRI